MYQCLTWLHHLRKYYSTGEINFTGRQTKTKRLHRLLSTLKMARLIIWTAVTIEYKDWWFNVRKSNTEPLLRLNLEGRTKTIMEQRKKQVIDIIKGAYEDSGINKDSQALG